MIDEGLPVGVDIDALSEPHALDIREGPNVIVCIGDMGGQHGVAGPGWVGGAFEVGHVVLEPGEIPASVSPKLKCPFRRTRKNGDIGTDEQETIEQLGSNAKIIRETDEPE